MYTSHVMFKQKGRVAFPVFSVVASKDAGVSTEIGNTHKYEGNPLWNQDRAWEPRLDNGYPNVIHDPSDPLGEYSSSS